MINRSYIYAHKDHRHYLTNSQALSLKKTAQLSSHDNQVLALIKALADPSKFKIYLILRQVTEISVSDLAFILKTSHSAVSHALADLKKMGLVESHRCEKLICYFLKKKNAKIDFRKILSKF